MDFSSDIVGRFLLGLVLVAILGAGLFLVHCLLTLPMRRAERARLFVDLIDTAVQQGQSIEETMISISQSRDESLGARFHLFAAWLEQNLGLSAALAKVPRFLPPQMRAMFRAGEAIGDVRKILPACRQLLKDAVSQTRDALNYLIIVTFVITPAGLFVFWTLMVLVLPKTRELVEGGMGSAAGLMFLSAHAPTILYLQVALLLLLWLAVCVYIGGPRLVSWFPVLERLHYRLPWRRKRMQRDFSAMLAVLLDSGVPEGEAVKLAADCSANEIFRRRAARAVEGLRQGMKLSDAVKEMDDAGEFGWRLANAIHGRGGFAAALAGWHESLDAKAFQEEQAAGHAITSALVLWSGVFVGVTVVSVFMWLVSIINQGLLW